MKKLILVSLVAAFSFNAAAATAYKAGETRGTMTKQCHYKYLGETYSITISNTKLCPLSIKV